MKTGDTTDEEAVFVITYEMVALWTIGSLLHSLIDLGAWHLSACACCMPGACCSFCGWLRTFGKYATLSLCFSFIALASTAAVMRANFEESNGSNSLNDLTDLDVEIRSFSFLSTYFVELTLVYFVYYPIMATLFFSGAVWSCLPCIGGRPKEIARQEEEKRKKLGDDDTFRDEPIV